MCATCGTELRETARFCDGCGSSVAAQTRPAEYKQVTVLFADVVRSMDLAAALEPERLREMMTAIFNSSAAVVQRYGGTVDKFTGDGIMALFGAPVALEDHAFRACLAALDIQNEMTLLTGEAQRLDGIDLRLRIGLNSGQVIAGDIDSGPGGYTAIGVEVGMAQRMESAAPPGGIAVSESTAHLVSHAAMLGEPERVLIKGSDSPVTTYRLLGTGDPGRRGHDTTLVGRVWELAALSGILDQAVGGSGTMVGVVGPPGIGKSRIVSEVTGKAARRGMEVFSTYCEAHAHDIPFHAVARLLRAVFGVSGVDPETARARLRVRLGAAGPEDLLLLDDLLGIRDPATPPPDVDPDARRRRLTNMINTASLNRTTPTVYVIEDAHWIDDVSDSMLADFISVIPQTPSLVITTYRPEYHGELTRVARSQAIALAPLDDSHTTSLISELLGEHSSVNGLAPRIAGRAAGNPFFAEEIVRDLAERGIIVGRRGEYMACRDIADINVPSTLHATIAARVDRLGITAKRTLTAAAAIGSRFSADLVARLVDHTDLPALVDADLIDQVMFTPRAEYAFRHPLIRTVAYESQLKSARADLHRRLATTIENDQPESVDENASMIAEHLEAAGDLPAAFGWHMRAGTWAQYRDIGAAAVSWRRARDVADGLPADDPARLAMRIAPRTLLCGNAWRIGGNVGDAGFEELRDLTGEAGDKLSLTIGMMGQLTALTFNDRITESSQLATECVALLESIGDPSLIVGLLSGPMQAKLLAGEMVETLRLAHRAIDLADGDPRMGNLVIGSPLAFALMFRGCAEMYLGMPGFREGYDAAIAAARPVDPTCLATVVFVKYAAGVPHGAYLPDDTAERDTTEALAVAEQTGDHFALASARIARGIILVTDRDGPDRSEGYDLLAAAREAALAHQCTLTGVRVVDITLARRKLDDADIDGAIELSRTVLADLAASGDGCFPGPATSILVEALLWRRADGDVDEAVAAIEKLAAIPTDPGYVVNELPLLRMRALLARVRSDKAGYREYADRYRVRATEVGFEGHMALAEAMA
jgi:adenylate cyclase